MKTFLITYKNRITISLLAALILMIAVTRIFNAPLVNEAAKSGIVSFELAKNLDNSVKILNSWDENAKISAGLSLGTDFVFLLVYSGFIAMLIFNINNRLWADKPFYRAGNYFIALIFLAALFDVIENISLIKLLLGNVDQTWSSLAYYFAIAKFTLILLCIVYLLINWAILLFRRPAVN